MKKRLTLILILNISKAYFSKSLFPFTSLWGNATVNSIQGFHYTKVYEHKNEILKLGEDPNLKFNLMIHV